MIILSYLFKDSVDREASVKPRSNTGSSQLDNSSESDTIAWSELRSNEDLLSLPKDSGKQINIPAYK